MITDFFMEIHILQMVYKYSNHHTDKECVGFLISFFMLNSELTLKLAIKYLEHIHNS
jgi:hypothetical protein